MIQARLTVEGFKEATTLLNEKGDRARNPDAVLRTRKVRSEFEGSVSRRYARGLPRAKRSWVLEKRRRGLDTRSMRATGRSEAALTHGAGPLGREVLFDASNGVVRFGVRRGRTGLYYMNALARGYPTTTGRVKPRRVVVIDKVLREHVAFLVVRFLDTGRT